MKLSSEQIHKRRCAILELLQHNDTLYVADICRTLGISEVTARRDLNELEQQHLLERIHGGARRINSSPHIPQTVPSAQASSPYAAEKHAIARMAAERIEDGDTIFISPSTTALLTLSYLGDKHVRVITNNYRVVNREYGPNLEILLTGGECNYRGKALCGDFASYAISQTRATRCILGANGVSPFHGLTTTYYTESPINKQMLSQCSGEKIVVAESRKIGVSDGFVYGMPQSIDTLITGAAADSLILQQLQGCGVNVVVVED